MSLLVTVFLSEGIIMASDTMISYNVIDKGIHRPMVYTNYTTRKTFSCPNNAGISVCGEALFMNLPITSYMDDFIDTRINDSTNVEDIPWMLIDYFYSFGNAPRSNFIVAGYQSKEQKVYKIKLADKSIEVVNTKKQGVTWDGETVTMIKLLKPTFIKDSNGDFMPLPFFEIPWNFFTLQDGIDFAKYAIKFTSDTMRFQNGMETVGGDADILHISPVRNEWISRQELH